MQTFNALVLSIPSSNAKPASLQSAAVLVYGETLYGQMLSVTHPTTDVPYLHDFVSLRATAFPNLAFESQLEIYKQLAIASAGQANIHNPTFVHWFVKEQEARLFHVCSLLSMLDESMQVEIIELMVTSIARAAQQADASADTLTCMIDLMVAEGAIRSLWLSVAALPLSDSNNWIGIRKHLAEDIEALLTNACLFDSDLRHVSSMDVSSVVQSWRGLQIIAIFCEELRHCGHSKSAAEATGEPAQKFRTLLQAVALADPSTLRSFEDIRQAAADYMAYYSSTWRGLTEKKQMRAFLGFIKRFLTEVVFSDLNGGRLPQTPLKQDLLTAIGRLVNGDIQLLGLPASQRQSEQAILSLRRSVLEMMLKTPIGRELVLSKESLSIEGLAQTATACQSVSQSVTPYILEFLYSRLECDARIICVTIDCMQVGLICKA